MQSTHQMPQQNRMNQYLINEIANASPVKLILKVYDFAILKCQKNDMCKTNDALQVLINALRFDTPESKTISLGLLKLYKYCQEEMRKKNNEVVLTILTELRDTWRETFNI